MATESESPKPIWTTRDKIIVAVCALGWLFIVLRYYPGDMGRSMYETGLKMFWSSGLAAIFTRLLVRFLAWIEKTKSSWPRIIKIFLALAIAFGIMLAIEDYKKYHLRPATEVSRPQVLSSPNYLLCNTVYLRIIGHEFCHSRNDSERESGLNCLKNHIPDRGIRG